MDVKTARLRKIGITCRCQPDKYEPVSKLILVETSHRLLNLKIKLGILRSLGRKSGFFRAKSQNHARS
jgi:hypothetical protein